MQLTLELCNFLNWRSPKFDFLFSLDWIMAETAQRETEPSLWPPIKKPYECSSVSSPNLVHAIDVK